MLVCVLVFNLHKQRGPIPSVATSMWQHVTHLISKHTHTYTHSPQCLTAAPQLSAGSSGYGRPAGQTLWKPLSHTHSPPPQGSGGDIRLPVQRRPGLALGAACDLVCLCVCVCFISQSLRISAHNAAVSSRYVGVIYSVAALMSTNTENLNSSSDLKHPEYSILHYTALCARKNVLSFKPNL